MEEVVDIRKELALHAKLTTIEKKLQTALEDEVRQQKTLLLGQSTGVGEMECLVVLMTHLEQEDMMEAVYMVNIAQER